MTVRRLPQEVELNVTSMLDMAFQLLAFFVLTFQPSPLEPEIDMASPEAKPIVFNAPGRPTITGVGTLRISLFSRQGALGRIAVGDHEMRTLGELHRKLEELFAGRADTFDQVLLEVSDRLNYGEVMQVVGVCWDAQPQTDKKVPKRLSFATRSGMEVP